VVKSMVDMVDNSLVKDMNTFFDIVLWIIFFYPTNWCYKTILLKKWEIFQLYKEIKHGVTDLGLQEITF
jgi:hypothetical protein